MLLVAFVIGTRRSARHPVLSENTGAFKCLEIQYTRDAAKTTWPVLCDFFSQLDGGVEVIGVCGSKEDSEELRSRWIWPNPLKTLVLGTTITGWSKDRFLVAPGKPSVLLGPSIPPTSLASRDHDAKVAGAIESQWPDRFRAARYPIVFDAGDILCTDGLAIFSDSLARKNGEPSDLATVVATMTGKNPFRLKGVPDHHIGMFAAPLDSKTVIVGDPDLGRQLWKPNPLGKPDFSNSVVEPFRRAAREFEKAGFQVIRAPLIVFGPQVYLTYTNGLFESRGDRKVAYVPVYGVPRLDDAGLQAYRTAGWETRPVRVEPVFRFRGTIGCLVNVLERR